VLLCSDSAGGAIVFLAAARLRDAGHPVDALLLTNPNLDLTLAMFDRDAPGGPDLTLLSDAIRSWAGPDPAGAGFSPLHTDLRDMPATVIAVGALDSLRPEAAEARQALQAAGVDCDLLVFDGIGHGFMGGDSPFEVAARERTLAAFRGAG
jgi:acetyl esterase